MNVWDVIEIERVNLGFRFMSRFDAILRSHSTSIQANCDLFFLELKRGARAGIVRSVRPLPQAWSKSCCLFLT